MESIVSALSNELFLTAFVLPVTAAIITTLVVEYFAKPSLEARKLRIVRDRQQLDELIFCFQKVGLAFGALIPDNISNEMKSRHNKLMLMEAMEGLQSIRKALSRIPSRYVVMHREHISQTSYYIGYLIAQTDSLISSRQMVISVEDISEKASKLSLFDTYFLANIYVGDHQEPWPRRFYWKAFSRKKNSDDIQSLFKNYDLHIGDKK